MGGAQGEGGVSALRWETRGMQGYCVDGTGRIVGELFYWFSKEHYSATLTNPGGSVPLGTYVSLEDARRAVENAVAVAVQAALHTKEENTHD